MASKTSNHRRLAIEGLEQRNLLAGNVQGVMSSDGTLTLTGDAAANHIVIYQGFRETFVSGGNSGTGVAGMTSVNGSLSPIGFPTATNIVLQMGDGADRVLVTNIALRGSIRGSLGDGNDRFAMHREGNTTVPFTLNGGQTPQYGDVSVGGDVRLEGGAGNDIFSLHDAIISGHAIINMGAGQDTFVQTGSSHDRNIVGQSLAVSGGPGDDSFSLNRIAVGRNLVINDRAALQRSSVTLTNVRVNLDIHVNTSDFADTVRLEGADNFGNRFQARGVFINTGAGADTVNVDQGIMVRLTVNAGPGDDGNGFFGVTTTNLRIDVQLTIDLGAGFDNALIEDVQARRVRVFGRGGSDGVIARRIQAFDAVYDMGDQRDILGLYDSFHSYLRVELGNGDDDLTVGNMNVNTRATFNGGAGANRYIDRGGNVFAQLIRNNI